MASGWSSKQKRRWMSLSVEETPGSFRRLNEDEARGADWPPATLPFSAATATSTATVNGKARDGKQPVSASLPRPKREGKPSLFTALTWSKGKKSRPKLSRADGLLQEGVAVAEAETAPPGPPQQGHSSANNGDYSERGVDVADGCGAGEAGYRKKAVTRLSASGGGHSSRDSPNVSPVDQTDSETRHEISDKAETAENHSSSTSLDQRPAEATKTTDNEFDQSDRDQKSKSTAETAGETIQQGETVNQQGEPILEGERAVAGETIREGETSRGETYYDTGRRFRLEATVMVDDERPAERRVTYLGPVLLSPLGQRHGQYVHVTVAPGSGVEAEEGSSLLVRPAKPVLIHSNSTLASAAKGASGSQDGGQAPDSAGGRSQGEAATPSLPSQGPDSGSVPPPGLKHRDEQDESAGGNQSRFREVEEDIMERGRADATTVGAAPGCRQAAHSSDSFSGTAGDRVSDDDADGVGGGGGGGGVDGDGEVYAGDSLPTELGKESLMVMRESSAAELGSAPSPIPVDESVFGTASPLHYPSSELGRTAFPVWQNDDGGRVMATSPESAPQPLHMRHQLSKSSSSSSSTSSLSASSTSSNDSKSKRNSHDFEVLGEKTTGDSDSRKSPENTEKNEEDATEMVDTAGEEPDKPSVAPEEESTEQQPKSIIVPEEAKSSEAEADPRAKPRRMDSFGRPRPELLDPHVLLAGEGARQKPAARDASPAAENRCDLKTHTTAGLHRLDVAGTSVPRSETIHNPQDDGDVDQGSAFEPYVISVTEETDNESHHEVVNDGDDTSQHACEKLSEDQPVEKNESLETTQDTTSTADEGKEETVLRQPAIRPQKPARTSLVKEDITIASMAPLDTAIDRPPLPLKGTPRTSSSSSSSSSSDSEEEKRSEKKPSEELAERESLGPAVAATEADVASHTQFCELHRELEATSEDDAGKHELEKSRDEKMSSSESERFETPRNFLQSKDADKDSSSANSSQFITDTSLAEQVDLPDFKETDIFASADARLEAVPKITSADDSPWPVLSEPPLNVSSSSSSSHKGHSDSGKSASSSKSGSKEKDPRKPPVFVTPPPPPTKPVRTCGSQSDLSDRSDAEHDAGQTPPKPSRASDRLSPSVSPALREDRKKSQSSASASSSFSEAEGRPPLVPPRRDKPRANGAHPTNSRDQPASVQPAARNSFTSSEDESKRSPRSKQRIAAASSPVVPFVAERKVDEVKLPTVSGQVLTAASDHSTAPTFIPYEDSGIYYKDIAPAHKEPGQQDLNSSRTSSSSDQSKKGKSPKEKVRKVDKSSGSSDEAKKARERDPPPVPPRQKVGSKKGAATGDPNTSASSTSSQGSKSSHDRPPQTPTVNAQLAQKPKATVEAASACVPEGSDIAPKLPESPQPVMSVEASIDVVDTAAASVDVQSEALPEVLAEESSAFDSELPLQKDVVVLTAQRPDIYQSLDAPGADVETPLKPQAPSPTVVTPRTPSASLAVERSQPASRPISSPGTYDVRIESMQNTDEETSEADVKSPVRRTLSASSTTSATSHEDDKEKKGGKSRLRKYWPFRRRKGDKKDKHKKEKEDGMRASSPHLPPSPPLHQSTPTLQRHASDSNASNKSASNKSEKRHQSKAADSDTSTLSEGANEQSKRKNKAKSKDADNKNGRLSTSTSSNDRESDKNKQDHPKDGESPAKELEENADSSKNVTPTPEKKIRKANKHKEETKHGKGERSADGGQEHDTSTSSSSFSKGSQDKKAVVDKPENEVKVDVVEPPLAPPRVATPLREAAPPSYPPAPQLEVQQPRFDGEFQRLDEDFQADAAAATAFSERRPPMVVVAVDLGTTHSGYAFSFSRDPGSVYVMSRWAGQEPGLLNHKTLSALLLTPDARFHSFGLAARNHFHNLLPIEARHWLYFERFKMTLHHCKELSRDTMVTAVNGKQLPALTVFAHVLEFFATHALQQLSDQSGTEFRRQDVRWVVTVPAIWREPAKQLMRQAALAGGMFTKENPSQLLIVLEPEAASIYCRRLRMHQLMPEVGTARPLQSPRRSMEVTSNMPAVSNLTVDGSKSTESLDSLSEPTLENKVKGTRYVVVDCGGGTVDITVHELSSSGQLIELHRATGGPHGSTGVDAEFEALLCSIFSSDFVDGYKRQFPVGWVNLMTDFESRKRAASPFKTTSFNVSLPFTFISEFRKHRGEVEQAVKRHGDPDVEWSLQGMLRLAPPAMRRLFAPTLVSIRQAIGDVLNHPNTRDLRYLFLVGGFAESPLLQYEVRREFGHLLTLLIPQDVSLAVLRGAVLFGLDPKVVSVRCARLTYGVGILNRFDPAKHPVQKRVHRNGVDWCTDVFDCFVSINQPVSLGTSVSRRYTPARSGQLLIVLNIYSSVHPVPSFITDPGVRKCGTLYLDLRQDEGQGSEGASRGGEGGVAVAGEDQPPREILVRMAFGDTEISVTALDVTSGKEVKATADFLSG